MKPSKSKTVFTGQFENKLTILCVSNKMSVAGGDGNGFCINHVAAAIVSLPVYVSDEPFNSKAAAGILAQVLFCKKQIELQGAATFTLVAKTQGERDLAGEV